MRRGPCVVWIDPRSSALRMMRWRRTVRASQARADDADADAVRTAAPEIRPDLVDLGAPTPVR